MADLFKDFLRWILLHPCLIIAVFSAYKLENVIGKFFLSWNFPKWISYFLGYGLSVAVIIGAAFLDVAWRKHCIKT